MLKIETMEIYYNGEELNFEHIHLTQFENAFNEMAENLPNMLAPDFSSLQELKSQNKETLETAFQSELSENL